MDKLFKIQESIGTVKKDSVNPFLKNKYVDINSLLEQVKPIFNEQKLLLLQPLTNVNGRPAIRTLVMDGKVAIVDDVITLPDLQDSQKMGGAITYYRRYSIISLLGLEAEDDDGNLASKPSVKQKVAKMEEEDQDPF